VAPAMPPVTSVVYVPRYVPSKLVSHLNHQCLAPVQSSITESGRRPGVSLFSIHELLRNSCAAWIRMLLGRASSRYLLNRGHLEYDNAKQRPNRPSCHCRSTRAPSTTPRPAAGTMTHTLSQPTAGPMRTF
jgi:hypothetical protein